jgi:hypothetical protein
LEKLAALSKVNFSSLPYDDSKTDSPKAEDATIIIPVSTFTDGNKVARVKFRLKDDGLYISFVKPGATTLVMFVQEAPVRELAEWFAENVVGE